MKNAAESIGTTADKLAELQFAFGRAGVRPEQAQRLLGGFANRLQEAARAEQEAQKTREDAAARSARSGRLVRLYSEQAEQIARTIDRGDEAITASLERLYRDAQRESIRGETALDRVAAQARMDEIARAVRAGADARRDLLLRQLEETRALREEAMREGARAQEELLRSSEPTNQTQRALRRLGVSVRDASGNVRTLHDALADVANAFQRLPDGPEKVSLAVDLFGEKGIRLIPVLNRGAAGMEQLAERARRLGVVLGPAGIEILTRYQEASDDLADTFTGLRNTLAVVLAPALTAFSETLQQIIERNRVAIGQGLADALERVRPVVNDLLIMLSGGQAQTDFVRGIIDDWNEVRRILGIVGRFVADELVPVFRDAIIPAVNAVREAFSFLAAEWNKLTGSNATGGQVAIALVVLRLVGVFNLLGSVIRLVFVTLRGSATLAFAALKPIAGVIAGIVKGLGSLAGAATAGGGAVAALGTALASTPAIIAGIVAGAVALGIALVQNWDAVRDGAKRAFDAVAAAFEEVVATLAEGAGFVVGFIVGAFENLPTLLRAAWDLVVTGFQAAWDFIPGFVQAVAQRFVEGFTDGLDALSTLIVSAFEGIRDALFSVLSGLFDFWKRQFDGLVRIFDRVRSAFSRGRETANQGIEEEARRRGYAGGGYVSGPGTGTSDSILARLSNGEFVIRAEAVRRYGVAFLAALNAMRLPAFAVGGMVQPIDVRIRSGLPAFAEGGLVSATSSGGRPLTLVVGGETISGFTGTETAMETLERRLRRDARARTAAPAPWQRRNG
jgi:hypothetical protein